jgi:hypothetical protein
MKFHSDLMSWQLVRVTRQQFFKIFSETIIPRTLIFCRNIPWVVLSKICSYDFAITNIFRTGSEKPWKLAKSLKFFFSGTVSATGEQKTVLKSIRGSFLKFVKATSCDRYLSDYAIETANVWKITISMLNILFTIGFSAKNIIARV